MNDRDPPPHQSPPAQPEADRRDAPPVDDRPAPQGIAAPHHADAAASADPAVSADEMRAEMARLGILHDPPHAPLPPPRRRQPDYSPHTLVLLWCLWLLGSWVVTTGLGTTLPSIRWLMLSCLLGVTALWPALRLSQDSRPAVDNPTGAAARAVTPRIIFTDWLCLMLVFQVVIWPLRLTARWSIVQTVWLDVAIGVWALLTGALIAWGVRASRGLQRTAAMAAVLLLLLGEPLLQALLNLPHARGGDLPHVSWPMRISPIGLIWHMAGPPLDWSARPWRAQVICAGIAAVAAWIIVVAAWRRTRALRFPLASEGEG